MNVNNPFTGTQPQTPSKTPMGDKEYLMDSLQSQKKISENYNTFASECVNTNLKNDFLNILRDEQQIEYELFASCRTGAGIRSSRPQPRSTIEAKICQYAKLKSI
jgi:hypothetical protein